MAIFSADLHLHTILSPCGDYGMTPKNIVAEARKRKLDLIAITDHNAHENVGAVVEAAAREGSMTVLGGMEITSAEEIHVLALFDDDKALGEVAAEVRSHLPGTNDRETIGDQVILGPGDEILGLCDRLLIGATTLPVEQVVELIHQYEGLAIAAHVDREVFSIISQLGYIPEGLELDAVEVSPHAAEFPASGILYDRPAITSSDAHYLHEIGRVCTKFELNSPRISELRSALRGENGRRVVR